MTSSFYFFGTVFFVLFFLFPTQSYAASQTFSSPDTYNLSLSGVSQITVSGSGGGGGGAGGAWDSNYSSPGNGGGGGAAAVNNTVINIPNGNVNLTVVVGGGGQGGPENYNLGPWIGGSSGGTTYLYVNNNLVLTLPGGGGGRWGNDYFNAGGSAGGTGGEEGGWGDRGCGGSGGSGGNSFFGTGGSATYGVAVSGNNGTGYGAGGSGASGGCSGNGGGPGGYGAPGFMTITWTPTTATLSASLSTIDQGQSLTLAWSSTNATSCTGTGFTAGGASGTSSTGILNSPGTSNYQVVCTGAGGTSAPAFASVEVLSPNVAISASPARLQIGANSQISWSASGVKSCTITGPSGTLASGNADAGHNFSTGSPVSTAIQYQSIFTITCQTNGAPVTKSVTVNVVPLFQDF